MIKRLLLGTILSASIVFSFAQQQSIDISTLKWKIWLDEKAAWMEDSVFLPPVSLERLPLNAPSCGWSQLYDGRGKSVNLPANVEEHFWGYNGNTFGIASNYKGVSWFFTKLHVPASMKGSRIVLKFESTRLRAEIFLNEVLCGYDLVNGTTYEVDITNAAKPGKLNNLAVRITDADGNFEWMDLAPHGWGNYKIPPSHGFGGITGRVFLQSRPAQYIDDIFIKNKPLVNSIDAVLTFNSNTSGNVQLDLVDTKAPSVVLQSKTIELSNQLSAAANFTLPNAKLWFVESPELYMVKATLKSNNSVYKSDKRFGFRWFEIKDDKGDKQFFLNGKRVVIRTSISWGYWPVNGITPTYALAKKQILAAKRLGLNCLNFHRHMGQEMLLDLADELGLLYYAEPGGYKTGIASTFTADWNRERMMRMIKLFRSHPSLILYNMINESTREPVANEIADIQLFHQVDETRCITFTSTNFTKMLYDGKLEEGVEKPAKMHMLPNDSTLYYKGWWDMHFADGPGVYKDIFYKNKDSMLRGSNNKGEIVFWGEEGAIGTPPRLQLDKKSFEAAGTLGWDGDYYVNQYKAFEKYLKEKGFSKAFPDVDSLCRSFGNNALYYQGRIIENIRINNTTDGYAVNGWENTKIENHSGVVDVWRNPKGNPDLMAHYNQPLYVAVKARNKVLAVDNKTMIDFFIVNEKNLSGNFLLKVKAIHNGKVLQTSDIAVKVSGGNIYGELLTADWQITLPEEGYTEVIAALTQKNKTMATGSDLLYAIKLPSDQITAKIMVSDSSGALQQMMTNSGIAFENEEALFNAKNKTLLLLDGGNLRYLKNTWRNHNEFLEWIANGNVAACISNADLFSEFLEKKEIVNYSGKMDISNVWYGGNYFNRTHPLFEGLPANTAFNWEYQCLAGYDKKRYGLRLQGEESVSGIYADHRQEVYTALAVISYGRGKIILSTFDLPKAINQDKNEASIVAKRLLLNYVLFMQQFIKQQ